MPRGRIVLCRLVALTFFSHHMNNYTALILLGYGKRSFQSINIVPIYGAYVPKAKLLEKAARQKKRLHAALKAVVQAP